MFTQEVKLRPPRLAASDATGVRVPGRRYEATWLHDSVLQTCRCLTDIPIPLMVSVLCSLVKSRNATWTYRISVDIPSLEKSATSMQQLSFIPLITYGNAQTRSSLIQQHMAWWLSTRMIAFYTYDLVAP